MQPRILTAAEIDTVAGGVDASTNIFNLLSGNGGISGDAVAIGGDPTKSSVTESMNGSVTGSTSGPPVDIAGSLPILMMLG